MRKQNEMLAVVKALNGLKRNERGRVLPPLILWMLGVPGGVVLLLWLFFFRG